MGDQRRRIYDSRWGWLLMGGFAWKLGRKPSRRRAILAAFVNPFDFDMYREARARSKRDGDSAELDRCRSPSSASLARGNG